MFDWRHNNSSSRSVATGILAAKKIDTLKILYEGGSVSYSVKLKCSHCMPSLIYGH